MKAKLTEYIDTIFADAERRAPGNQDLSELKEEMLQNLNEKYEDLIAGGKSPAAAYNIAISNMGDISVLLDSVCGPQAGGTPSDKNTAGSPKPRRTPEDEAEIQKFRNRSAILTSIAVALYILCVVPCIITDNDVGAVLMFLMIAGATAILIFNGMSKPKCLQDEEEGADGSDAEKKTKKDDGRPPRSSVYKVISATLWILTTCAFLIVSFATGLWLVTWMLFLIAAATDNIIKAIFDIRR